MCGLEGFGGGLEGGVGGEEGVVCGLEGGEFRGFGAPVGGKFGEFGVEGEVGFGGGGLGLFELVAEVVDCELQNSVLKGRLGMN